MLYAIFGPVCKYFLRIISTAVFNRINNWWRLGELKFNTMV